MAVSLRLEKALKKRGFSLVAGVDEAGRGPLAGPVVAAAVILDRTKTIPGLDDSKKLSPSKRNKLLKKILKYCISVGIGMASEQEIEKLNILQASLSAMRKALSNMGSRIDCVLVDGNIKIPGLAVKQYTIVRGDGISSSIAAASIIAKVWRDGYMENLHKMYPKYGFIKHKGYGTKLHFAAIRKFGLSPVHRKSFCKNVVAQAGM